MNVLEQYVRALWLAIRITRRPWSDKNEPFCNISPRLAWQISRDIWFGKDSKEAKHG